MLPGVGTHHDARLVAGVKRLFFFGVAVDGEVGLCMGNGEGFAREDGAAVLYYTRYVLRYQKKYGGWYVSYEEKTPCMSGVCGRESGEMQQGSGRLNHTP